MKIALRLILMFVILALIGISMGGAGYYIITNQALEEKIEVLSVLSIVTIMLIATVYPQLAKKEVIDRLLELEKEYGALEPMVSFKISEEIFSRLFNSL